jgi:hypothetical protein
MYYFDEPNPRCETGVYKMLQDYTITYYTGMVVESHRFVGDCRGQEDYDTSYFVSDEVIEEEPWGDPYVPRGQQPLCVREGLGALA